MLQLVEEVRNTQDALSLRMKSETKYDTARIQIVTLEVYRFLDTSFLYIYVFFFNTAEERIDLSWA